MSEFLDILKVMQEKALRRARAVEFPPSTELANAVAGN